LYEVRTFAGICKKLKQSERETRHSHIYEMLKLRKCEASHPLPDVLMTRRLSKVVILLFTYIHHNSESMGDSVSKKQQNALRVMEFEDETLS